MFDKNMRAQVTQQRLDWEDHEVRESIERLPETRDNCTTLSGVRGHDQSDRGRVLSARDCEFRVLDCGT